MDAIDWCRLVGINSISEDGVVERVEHSFCFKVNFIVPDFGGIEKGGKKKVFVQNKSSRMSEAVFVRDVQFQNV
ncbi:hypothetical protein DERF_010790 [Dermatophagoides farinae]|uniref:Uncharacterized protein n=1 Tax=Dermatophagoides farinae TaxID=6954 RepID=A0A922HRP2_DERFA|nr:hypothetical protein DERF_010790 [Dermatophagoides farinae]